MRREDRSAVLIWGGIVVLVGALLLDTWRAGEFFLRHALIAGAVFIGAGVLLSLVAMARPSDPTRRARWAVALPTAFVAVIVVQVVGFGILDRKGYSANVRQFVRIRELRPFGPAQFDRAPDGAILMTMTHGSGVAVERTMFPLDVTPSAEHLSAARDLVERTRHAAGQFSDFEVARTTLGFSIAAAELEGDDSPTIEHLVNPENMMDDRLLDPDFPESLVFQLVPSGERKLVAIMYMTRPGQHGPQVGGPLTRWHWHPTAPACMDEFGIIREKKVDGSCREGLSGGPTSEMLHVWLVDHSFGAFAHLMGSPGDGTSAAARDHSGHH